MTGEQLRAALARYVPAEAVETCIDWIRQYNIRVRVKQSRQSKYGDYRPPTGKTGHVITINHDLNPYAFLLTFTHEVAHLTCFMKHRDRVAPHGHEWKAEFRGLISGFLDRGIFPPRTAVAIKNYMKNPAATSCADVELMKALREHDRNEEGWQVLEEVPFNAAFRLKNGMHFIKGHRLRKNYECFEIESRHKYFIHPLMEVMPLS